MKCLNCGQRYIAYDSDAGTFREYFCSMECAYENEKKIDAYLDKQNITHRYSGHRRRAADLRR